MLKASIVLISAFVAPLACGEGSSAALTVEAPPLADTRDPVGPYHVTAWVTGSWTVEVRLHHRSSREEAPATQVMTETSPGFFEAGIPGREPGTTVHWFVEVEDASGHKAYSPATARWGDAACYSPSMLEDPPLQDGAAYCIEVLR